MQFFIVWLIFAEIISLTIPHTLFHDSAFIGSFCYGIMSQAIRSEVDKQIISLCCRVLLNLARYKPTQQNVFQVSRKASIRIILSEFLIVCSNLNRFIISRLLHKFCTDGATRIVISSMFCVHYYLCSFNVQPLTR